ncbi:MAG: hypothetical protein G01um101477_600 [Candidatus Doudnabacteria bacterium Gr01-1014_77]|uniref:Uncharacterized protein n=1 Tax=Candidatus Doudnabacteria bacterium Gr01-1014_77 TaxID=2017133 RepID=A0A554JA44_9BACT|nr:MAG: hypothetical protein G01um101477_600 [Candidatus Doudnabacteria bacterium Gr01-1014_77]
MEQNIRLDLADIDAFRASYEKIYGYQISESEAIVIMKNLNTFLDIIEEKYNI